MVYTKAFTKFAHLKVTKEITEEGLITLITELISVVPPKLFNLAVKKKITLLEYLEWAKDFTKKKYQEHLAKGLKKKAKIDMNIMKMIKTIYATIGAIKLATKTYSPYKVKKFFDEVNLKERLKKALPKAKEVDFEGYRNLVYLLKLIEANPSWWKKQVNELRRLFLGEL